MAQIIKKCSDLETNYLKFNSRFKIALFVCIGCFAGLFLVGYTFNAFVSPITIPIFIAFFISSVVAALSKQKANIYYYGLQGESVTAEVIHSLPHNYFGVQNLKVTYKGETSELDMVVVGPTGVFVVETKNQNGTVVGNYAATHWTQHKVGRKGTPYSKNFYSPVKQVGTHVYRLANYLRSNGIKVFVNSAVYFSNADTAVNLSGTPSQTPVFAAITGGAVKLKNYITVGSEVLSADEINKVIKLLNK